MIIPSVLYQLHSNLFHTISYQSDDITHATVNIFFEEHPLHVIGGIETTKLSSWDQVEKL